MLLVLLARSGSLRRARRMADRSCFMRFCHEPRRDVRGHYCAMHMRCSWCSARDRVGVYATCSVCFALTDPQRLLQPVGRALYALTRRVSADFVADAVPRLLGQPSPPRWLSSIIAEFLGERLCMWYWLTALAAGRASTSQTSYMERLRATHVQCQQVLGRNDWVHDSWDTTAEHTLIAPMFVFYCAFAHSQSPVSYPSELNLNGHHDCLLLRSLPNITNHNDYPDYGDPPDIGALRMLTRRDVNSLYITRSINPYALYGERARPDDLALIGDLRLPLALWGDDTISGEENVWTFAPPLREYFEYSFRRDHNSPTVMSVMHAGLRGAHVSLNVPPGESNSRSWPPGPVHVFFQSSRHLQMSLWSEAFAVLIDSFIFAFFRLLHSSHAQDTMFDIDLGHILPEATGLRLLLRHCSLVPNPRDGWCPITPLPVPCAPPGDSANLDMDVHAFLLVDPPRRISALHLFAVPLGDAVLGESMAGLHRLDRVVAKFISDAERCTICDNACRKLAFIPLLHWALRYTRDYAGRVHEHGFDVDVLDLSRISGTFTHNAPWGCSRINFLLIPYMHTDAILEAFASPSPSCCDYCEKCGVLLGIFDLFAVDLPGVVSTVPKCNCDMTQFFQTWWTEAGAYELPICSGCRNPRTCPQDHQACY